MDLPRLSDRSTEWLRGGPEGDVVVSSRVRLARNIDGFPFVFRCSAKQRARVEELARNVLLSLGLESPLRYLRLDGLGALQRELLLERNLVSRLLAEADWVRGVAFDDPECTAVMVNEEDHLRLHCIRGGLRLDEVYESADRLDDVLAERMPFAYSPKYGYLTASPLNVGTGMRASVLLHLPAVVMAQEVDRLIAIVQEQNLAVRGIYGEGTYGPGHFYQVYNHVTLGLSEEEIVAAVDRAAAKLVELERSCRQSLYVNYPGEFQSRVRRAYELLCTASALSSQETLSFLSQVRMGVNLDLLDGPSMETVSDLFLLTLPAHLQTMGGGELDSSVRNELRASYVRKRLATG
jgi:protein arginine kinase